MKKEILRMERITYREQELTKLQDFNLQLFAGEIMGLLPVNTHGRKSFLRLLQHNAPIYDGYVYYNEHLVNSWQDSAGDFNRITIIQDRSSLVGDLTVADNIFVLRRGFRQEVLSCTILQHQLQPFMEEIHLNLQANTYACNLSVFERIVVELLKGIVAGHALIVLDDIATMVAGEELQKIHEIVRYYAQKGRTFLYIASHMEDIAQICDRMALLANGRIQKVLQPHEMNIYALRNITHDYDRLIASRQNNRLHEDAQTQQPPVCTVFHPFSDALCALDFTLQQGECLVVQCLCNQHYAEMVQSLKTLLLPADATITVEGVPQKLEQNRTISIIQEYASKTMLFPELSYLDNLCFNLDNRMHEVWRTGGVKRSIRKEYATRLGDVFDIPVANLSEKQKLQLLYTRIQLQKPRVVFCIQPFKGADMALRMYIWELLSGLLAQGIAVVILSVNLADSLALADRLLQLDEDGVQHLYHRNDFAQIPTLVPWKHLYT